MKIASSAHAAFFQSSTALGLALLSIAFSAPLAHAADPVLAAPPAINVNALPSGTTGVGEMPTPPTPGDSNHAGNLGPLENKVTDSVKGLVKQMGSTENVDLENLNTARQVVAKLDALIDIEKRLAELEKVKSERTGERNLASAIPASALAPPSRPSALPPATERPSAPIPVVAERSEISRIIGAAGHYAAVVQEKEFYVGDHLPDGSQIISISAKAVEVKLKDGATRQLKIKGVTTVYGDTL